MRNKKLRHPKPLIQEIKKEKIVLRRFYLKLYIFKLLLFVSMIEVSILYYFFYPWMKKWESAEKEIWSTTERYI